MYEHADNKAERAKIKRQLSQLPGGAFGPHAQQRANLIRRAWELLQYGKR